MTEAETKTAAEAKATAQHDEFVMALSSTTPLGRLNRAEVRAVLSKATELGYAFTKMVIA